MNRRTIAISLALLAAAAGGSITSAGLAANAAATHHVSNLHYSLSVSGHITAHAAVGGDTHRSTFTPDAIAVQMTKDSGGFTLTRITVSNDGRHRYWSADRPWDPYHSIAWTCPDWVQHDALELEQAFNDRFQG